MRLGEKKQKIINKGLNTKERNTPWRLILEFFHDAEQKREVINRNRVDRLPCLMDAVIGMAGMQK